ncbi:putative inclusion membrane protein C [Chlamydia ibidis]|uniref:Inclusion membrane protein C n=2 Tax=Chlamydia ibidis TaxID=1405396 RepID=A0ABN0MZR7_9CHLA|nr:hypothetical protein [Chlamydia ibidis]EPP34410.1 putative inclusion membrane protein C [Chlamydia ibidis]EQM62781.1 inclusion membrane protein C [Chlamydia ibidis 10-1398/6]
MTLSGTSNVHDLSMIHPRGSGSDGNTEILSRLSALQHSLANLQQQHISPWALPAQSSVFPSPDAGSSTIHISRALQHHMQTTASSFSGLRNELAELRSKLHRISSPASICNGPMALAAFLLAVSFVAIIIITLASLGLAGLLPQVQVLLVNTANCIWSIVSASIITIICLISVLSITLIKHNKPTNETPVQSS